MKCDQATPAHIVYVRRQSITHAKRTNVIGRCRSRRHIFNWNVLSSVARMVRPLASNHIKHSVALCAPIGGRIDHKTRTEGIFSFIKKQKHRRREIECNRIAPAVKCACCVGALELVGNVARGKIIKIIIFYRISTAEFDVSVSLCVN